MAPLARIRVSLAGQLSRTRDDGQPYGTSSAIFGGYPLGHVPRRVAGADDGDLHRRGDALHRGIVETVHEHHRLRLSRGVGDRWQLPESVRPVLRVVKPRPDELTRQPRANRAVRVDHEHARRHTAAVFAQGLNAHVR